MDTKYIHTKPSVDKISDLVTIKSSKLYNLTVGEIVCYKSVDGVTNLERIYSRYEAMSDADYAKMTSDISKAAALSGDAVNSFKPLYNDLKVGTELVIPSSFIYRGMPITDKIEPFLDTKEPFLSNQLKSLLEDEGFVEYKHEQNVSFGLEDVAPASSVFIWARALGDGGYLDGEMIDITTFIHSISTTKDAVKGSWSVNVVFHGTSSYEATEDGGDRGGDPRYRESVISPRTGRWNRKEFDLDLIRSSSAFNDAVLNRHEQSTGKRVRTTSTFQTIFAKNDIVFIRMSKLANEADGMNDLFGMNYDMIGVIESVREMTNATGDIASISISGGDITELIAQDGTSIYENRYISGATPAEEVELESDIFRMWGKHTSMFQFREQTLESKIRFVLDYMTQTKVCEGLFDPHPNARTVKFDIGDGSQLVSSGVKGIWKGVDVEIDPAVAERMLFVGEIGNSYSPILNQMQQICPPHLVEFMTDTYGSRFFIMARKPPYDRKSVTYYAENYQDSTKVKTISESVVLSDSLEFTNLAYTWYKMDYNMLANLLGEENFQWLLPAKQFPEYADIWGDKPLKVSDPFVDFSIRGAADGDGLLGGKMILQCLKDFRFIIETSAYLPFTRTGGVSITGDRTIKRGTWVYLESTDEIGHVDSISHRHSVSMGAEYTTELSLSRVMRREDVASYFALINMPIDEGKGNLDNALFITDTVTSWKVNVNNFEYFIKRGQYR